MLTAVAQTASDAARAARGQYLAELLTATMRGEDSDAEAQDWLARLIALCGRFATEENIAPWYRLETDRLLKLTR